MCSENYGALVKLDAYQTHRTCLQTHKHIYPVPWSESCGTVISASAYVSVSDVSHENYLYNVCCFHDVS